MRGQLTFRCQARMCLSHVCSFVEQALLDFLLCCSLQYYAFVEEKQKVHCLNTLFSKVSISSAMLLPLCDPMQSCYFLFAELHGLPPSI